ncbi:MAG: hypothetical protein ABW203_04485 [Novosphingobium sp.]
MHGLLAATALLLASEGSSGGALRARVGHAPRAVAAFIERRASCNHFTGEEPYDKERAAYLNRVIRELRCERIDRDERRLRSAYRRRPAILRLLDDTADLLGW